jgi:hypothetical protein
MVELYSNDKGALTLRRDRISAAFESCLNVSFSRFTAGFDRGTETCFTDSPPSKNWIFLDISNMNLDPLSLDLQLSELLNQTTCSTSTGKVCNPAQ